MRRALVLANKIVAGTLTETDDMHYIFEYDDEYLINPEFRAISLAFPKRKEVYVSDELFPFFYNMLSEGGKKVSHILDLSIDDDTGVDIVAVINKISISGVQEKISAIIQKGKIIITPEGESGRYILKPIPEYKSLRFRCLF